MEDGDDRHCEQVDGFDNLAAIGAPEDSVLVLQNHDVGGIELRGRSRGTFTFTTYPLMVDFRGEVVLVLIDHRDDAYPVVPGAK